MFVRILSVPHPALDWAWVGNLSDVSCKSLSAYDIAEWMNE